MLGCMSGKKHAKNSGVRLLEGTSPHLATLRKLEEQLHQLKLNESVSFEEITQPDAPGRW